VRTIKNSQTAVNRMITGEKGNANGKKGSHEGGSFSSHGRPFSRSWKRKPTRPGGRGPQFIQKQKKMPVPYGVGGVGVRGQQKKKEQFAGLNHALLEKRERINHTPWSGSQRKIEKLSRKMRERWKKGRGWGGLFSEASNPVLVGHMAGKGETGGSRILSRRTFFQERNRPANCPFEGLGEQPEPFCEH